MIGRFALLAVLVSGAVYAGTHNPRGTIAFGDGYDTNTNAIQGPHTEFPTAGSIAWVGHFSRGLQTTQLTRVVLSQSSHSPERVAGAVDVSIDDKDAIGIYATRSIADLEHEMGIGPGKYIMQYRVGTNILAEGAFTINR